jgi:outer membrane protein insertion porin family
MPAPRAPAVAVAVVICTRPAPRRASALAVGVVATLVCGGVARADAPPPAGAPLSSEVAGGDDASAAPFDDAHFGPRYTIEAVVVRGNRKTATALILAELSAIGLREGKQVDASDPRVEAARYRLLTLGFFLDVRLSVSRGSSRGSVVLAADVEERGTLVINELFPATSAATAFWGGADVSETNFFGRGINLGAGFVASTTPDVLGAEPGLGLRLRGAVPALGGPYGPSFSATALYNDGSEFYRVAGDPDDADPSLFIAGRVRRAGGMLGAGKDFRSGLHASLDFREEVVQATLPDTGAGGLPPIDFKVQNGTSRIGTIAGGLELDTRSDPILPRSGARVTLSVELGTGLVGSSYDYLKTVLEASFYKPLRRGHALGFHLFAGAIAGEAPYFDQFFIGDLNLLLPRRALGINFSTQPSRNLLDTSIAHHRYDDFAGRLLVEYAIPIWRRRGLIYGGDAFVAVGLLGMASRGDFIPPGTSGLRALPIDVTGDLGLRLDTSVGIFTLSVANALSRLSF